MVSLVVNFEMLSIFLFDLISLFLYSLQEKFTLTITSLLEHTSIPLAIHIIGEDKSQEIALSILKKNAPNAKDKYRVCCINYFCIDIVITTSTIAVISL